MGKYCCDQSIFYNMKEVKTTIPNNCELVKEGDSYVVKEKKNNPPRSWEEFCENYPINNEEFFIMGGNNNISSICEGRRSASNDKNLCINKEEAEAFLALMQLRQLRKAWVGIGNKRTVRIVLQSYMTSKVILLLHIIVYIGLHHPYPFHQQQWPRIFFPASDTFVKLLKSCCNGKFYSTGIYS